MPSFRTGRVVRIDFERPGLQRVAVLLDGDDAPADAVNLPTLTGDVAVGDEVVCNTTAVELGLGTGGAHFVHWNLARRDLQARSGGHIMKLRYTSLQTDVRTVEEDAAVVAAASGAASGATNDDIGDLPDVAQMPVVIAGLHSLVAAVAGGIAAAVAEAGGASGAAPAPLRVAYLMTDGAALPLALSDLHAALRAAGFIDFSVTAGHAFGGDLEAVTVASGLCAARAAGADVVIVAMGPGVVGTGSAFGSTAWEVAALLTDALAVGARPVVALRYSDADPRARHRGLSHHTRTALCAGPVAGPSDAPIEVVVPAIGGVAQAEIEAALVSSGIAERHRVVLESTSDAIARLETAGIPLRSMRRGVADDGVFWAAGAAAGVRAGRLALGTAGSVSDVAAGGYPNEAEQR